MDIAVITGASSGLGQEYAKTIIDLYPSLDEIWLIARRKDRLECFAEEHVLTLIGTNFVSAQ